MKILYLYRYNTRTLFQSQETYYTDFDKVFEISHSECSVVLVLSYLPTTLIIRVYPDFYREICQAWNDWNYFCKRSNSQSLSVRAVERGYFNQRLSIDSGTGDDITGILTR